MAVVFNTKLMFWALGAIQPASARNIIEFIGIIYPEVTPLPKVKDLNIILDAWREKGYVSRVHGKSRLFSLTHLGNFQLNSKLRKHRDKTRLFLLKSIRSDIYKLSGVACQKLAGDSPAVNGSLNTQEGRPIETAAFPRSPRKIGRFYWPPISKQLKLRAGSGFSSPDVFLKYYSFPSINSIHRISNDPADKNDLSITDFALALGISPRLITSFLHATNITGNITLENVEGASVKLVPQKFS